MESFEIDWTHQNSLKNWMTELNLICEEPIKIGLMGAISFASFSIGSLTFTDMIDSKGRKIVVLGSSIVTPLGIIALLLFAENLTHIYVIMFIIGLAYNPRSSVAYLYGSEFLQKKEQLKFGALNFTYCGLF